MVMRRLQFKVNPKTPQDARFYSPERDLAYIGSDLIRASMYALDDQYQEEWFKEFLAKYAVDEKDMAEAAATLAQACNRIIGDENPVVALEAVGFTELPPPLQMALYCKMGQVLLSAIWSGVKDTSKQGSEPPATIQELIQTAEDVMEHFGRRSRGESITNDTAEDIGG